MKWVLSIVLGVLGVVGCAGGDHRHPAAPSAAQRAYGLESISLNDPRAGQLSASRVWERGAAGRPISHADDAELRALFANDLARVLPLDAAAPLRIRATLTLQDAGYFEGLAAEVADVTVVAELLDAQGNVLRTITLREAASAPLQRSASRRARLEAAFDRLARRLAAQL